MAREHTRSHELFERARRLIPGGVNSPVRAFRAVDGDPPFIERGKGSHIWDADGNEYIDCVCSWGPLILGHAHPAVVETVTKTAERGTSFGAPTELEVELAQRLVEALPSVEMVRLVNSGTEAVMSALRLARAFTRRTKVLKFEGCYHGHSDGMLAKAGSGVATLGLPDSPGVPPAFAAETLLAPYNDLAAAEQAVAQAGEELACIIVEPIAGNMGVVPPAPGFLQGLRDLCERSGALLVFDEVITGFRVAYGGAQTLYGVNPDLTVLGKIIGGGFPIGAYGGKREIMKMVAPEGPMYQAGTLSGNPVGVAAGIATLDALREPEGFAAFETTSVYEPLEAASARLAQGLVETALDAGINFTLNRVGSMLTLFFGTGRVADYATAKKSDTRRYARFFNARLERGVYLPPSQFEAMFLSTAHTDQDLDSIIEAARHAVLLPA